MIDANYDYYLDVLGFSKITLKKVYPEEAELVFYEVEPPEWSSLIPTQIPVAVYDASLDHTSFGILEVGFYD